MPMRAPTKAHTPASTAAPVEVKKKPIFTDNLLVLYKNNTHEQCLALGMKTEDTEGHSFLRGLVNRLRPNGQDPSLFYPN